MNEYRREILTKISQLRQSNVICYVGGDRQNVSIRLAPDIIPVFYKYLNQIGKSDKIDLFLFSKGGDVLTSLRLVELIYEYTGNFSVLIPYKAYSAGTLICLGASEILMTKMAELSPVDPNVTSIFNPVDDCNPQIKVPINVEDVYSFLSIANDVVGLKSDEAMIKVFTNLTEHVHPLAVGSIYRTHALIRSVAKSLLMTHMDYNDEYKVNEIINTLTERIHSHSYMITRREARDIIKLPVTYCSDELEDLLWQLYRAYEEDLKLNEPFSPEKNADINGRFSVCSGIIETISSTEGYVFDGIMGRTNNDPNSPVNINIVNQGWRPLHDERI
jgi:hypothetical protein